MLARGVGADGLGQVGSRLKLIEAWSQRLDIRHRMRHWDSADVGRKGNPHATH